MKSGKHEQIKRMVLAAMFLAIGQVLPFLTGQIPQIGRMLLPMHIPVFLCALICGWQYGVPMAFLLPLMRSLLFGMPLFFPTAISMAFELAAYAFVAGFLYARSRWQCIRALYVAMIAAMVVGRLVWGGAQALLLGLSGNSFPFSAFLAGAVTNAIPGILLQLILIPSLMLALDRTKLVPFRRQTEEQPVVEQYE